MEFDDIDKVSKDNDRDEFKLDIKKPEIFLPADIDFERIDLEVMSNMKFYRSIPPQLSKDETKNIKEGTNSMRKVVRSTQALNILATLFDGGSSIFFFSSMRALQLQAQTGLIPVRFPA